MYFDAILCFLYLKTDWNHPETRFTRHRDDSNYQKHNFGVNFGFCEILVIYTGKPPLNELWQSLESI